MVDGVLYRCDPKRRLVSKLWEQKKVAEGKCVSSIVYREIIDVFW